MVRRDESLEGILMFVHLLTSKRVAYLCLEANHMDIIEMENTEMLLKAQHQHPQVATKIDIEFSDLVYRVKQPRSKEKKIVLNGISGHFRAGELTAIMGPSGAGKSSLLNILTGLITNNVTGSIQFGRDNVKGRKNCSYIMQEDQFFGFFTVEEVMIFSASLKISNQCLQLKAKQELIDGILDSLKLSACKKTRCSRLSGGQKKRLSIALELIDNPSVLFLDEPTTGLDSLTSMDTIQLLQSLAIEGRTIVCTIHQPCARTFAMFNQIYVMSRGYCTFRGAPHQTVEYLGGLGLQCPAFHNPADFLLECVNGDYGDYVQQLSEEAQKPQWSHCLESCDPSQNTFRRVPFTKISFSITPGDKTKTNCPVSSNQQSRSATSYNSPPSEFMRLWLLIGRCHMQILRDWTLTHLKLLLHVVCGILIGLFFGDSGSNANKQISNFGSLIIHCVYLWYTTSMPAILRYPQEIPIIKKETFNNWYKLRTYYLATVITSAPVHILFSVVYISITYLLTDQLLELDRYAKFLLTTMVLTMCADGMGIFLGTILSPVNGVFIGSVATCFMIIYSGFLIFLTHMSKLMQWISYVSPLRYSLENLVIAIYANDRPNTICPPNVIYCHFKNAITVLRTFGMENGSYGFNLSMLLLHLLLFKCCAYFTLRRKVNSLS